MRAAVLIAVLSLAFALSASAQIILMGVGPGGSPTGAALTPCAAGQLDFSDATGCNLTLFMAGL